MPSKRGERRPRIQYLIVDQEEFRRQLEENNWRRLRGRPSGRLGHEGRLLREKATIGGPVWAYSAKQAVAFVMIQKRGYSLGDVYGRFVAIPRDHWRRLVASATIRLGDLNPADPIDEMLARPAVRAAMEENLVRPQQLSLRLRS